MKITITELK